MATMDDEWKAECERLAKLAWPTAGKIIVQPEQGLVVAQYFSHHIDLLSVAATPDGSEPARGKHPRSADAMLAALRVLAGEKVVGDE